MKLIGLLLPLALLSTQAGAATAAGTWNNRGGNAAHTGYVDIKTNPDKFNVAWTNSFVTSGYTDGLQLTNPTITDHMLYVTVKVYSHLGDTKINGIYALKTSTGETVWKKILGPRDYFTSSPVFDNDKVFWLTGHKDYYQLTAVDAETGTLKLTSTIDINDEISALGTPVIYDHHLYIGDNIYHKQGYQYSVNSESGHIDWVVPAGDDQGEPTVSEKYIFRNNYPGVDVINRQTGEKFFISITSNSRYTESTPVWDEKSKTLYALNNTFDSDISELVAVDIEQRQIKWRFTLKGYYLFQPVVAGDRIYICDFANNSTLYEVNAVTGKINWSTRTDISAYDMLVTNDVIFISSAGIDSPTIAISRETHKPVWSYGKNGVLSMDANHLYLISSKDTKGIEVTAISFNQV